MVVDLWLSTKSASLIRKGGGVWTQKKVFCLCMGVGPSEDRLETWRFACKFFVYGPRLDGTSYYFCNIFNTESAIVKFGACRATSIQTTVYSGQVSGMFGFYAFQNLSANSIGVEASGTYLQRNTIAQPGPTGLDPGFRSPINDDETLMNSTHCMNSPDWRAVGPDYYTLKGWCYVCRPKIFANRPTLASFDRASKAM